MAGSLQDRDTSLADLLRSRARSASDTRLAADVAIGLIAALMALVWPFPFRVVVIEAAQCFMTFGVWGIADRELQERGEVASPTMRRRLRIAQLLAIGIGSAAAVALAVTLMGIAIGRVIS